MKNVIVLHNDGANKKRKSQKSEGLSWTDKVGREEKATSQSSLSSHLFFLGHRQTFGAREGKKLKFKAHRHHFIHLLKYLNYSQNNIDVYICAQGVKRADFASSVSISGECIECQTGGDIKTHFDGDGEGERRKVASSFTFQLSDNR